MASDDPVQTLTMAGGVIVFAVGIYQYWRAQQWKRSEFIASEIKAMRGDPSAQTMMQMLDWDGRRADLFPLKAQGRWVLEKHDELVRALRIDTTGEGSDRKEEEFSSKEGRIRDVADTFLEHLDRFGHFVEMELVAAAEFRPYVKYWFDLIADSYEDRPLGTAPVWRKALQLFIVHYGYRGVILLANGMGYQMNLASLPRD